MRRAPAVCLVTLAMVVAPLVLTSGQAGAAVDGKPLVRVDFDSLAKGSPSVSSGSLATTVKVSKSGGGAVKAGPDPDGAASGEFPAWDGTAPYQRAAVTVLSKESGDPLSPGARDFELGARFNLDSKTQGGRDNGNNLVQRGLFHDNAQYKLQVDGGKVSCRVKGSRGAQTLRSPVTVRAGAWYATSCARDGDRLVLKVTRPDGSGSTRSVAFRAGSITMRSSSVRVSIGAKVGRSGAVMAGDADQFNGLIDDAYVTIAQ
jgi:hypothetical protein